MALLWGRKAEITIATTLITDLRMQFSVIRTLRSEPNQASVKVWNLSPDTRSLIEDEMVPVRIEAGYEDTIGQIFIGYMRRPKTVREGPDLITSLEAGDGETAVRSSRINVSFNPGASFTNILKKLLDTLGLSGLGTKGAQRNLSSIKLRGAITSIINGIALNGGAWKEFQKLLVGSGYEASIQDGQVQILESGQPTTEMAVVLTPSTGLIGSPEKGEKGIVKCRSLMQPRIRPGRKVQIQSEFIDGFYRADVVNHNGDTHGQEWYTDIEASPL